MPARDWRPDILKADGAQWVTSNNPNNPMAKQHFGSRRGDGYRAACGVTLELATVVPVGSEMPKCQKCLHVMS